MSFNFDNEDFTINNDLVVMKDPAKVKVIKRKLMGILFIIFALCGFSVFTFVKFIFGFVLFLLGYWCVLKIVPKSLFLDKIVSIILPPLMNNVDRSLSKIKLELLKNIEGKILDIGCGSGTFFPYYKKSGKKITEIVALEPNDKLHEVLSQNIKKEGFSSITTITNKYIENLEYSNNYFDSIVFGNVLCEIPDIESALNNCVKLLKPGGRIYYIEHVGDVKGSRRRKFQDNFNWFYKVVSGGCNLNKDTYNYIKNLKNTTHQNWTINVSSIRYDVQLHEIGIIVKNK